MTKNITPLSWVVDSIGATTQTTANLILRFLNVNYLCIHSIHLYTL